MARTLLFLLLSAFYLLSPAQDRLNIVQGQIIDEDENPLEGAAVYLETTTIGAFTDADGKFKISTSLNEGVLQISYIGTERKQIPFEFGSKQQIDFGTIILESAEMICCFCYFGYPEPNINSENVWPISYAQGRSAIRNSLNTYSEQAVLNGQLPGLSVPQAANPQAHFQSAYYGQASQTMSNGIPLNPNSQMGNALLWELETQEIGLLDPQEALMEAGVRGINGGLNYQSQPTIQQGLSYRNALGQGLQEHHLNYGLSHKLGGTQISAHHLNGRFSTLPDWQMQAVSLANELDNKHFRLFTELQAGQVSWGDSFGERQHEQLAILYNQLDYTFGNGTSLNLNHNSQWFNQSDSLFSPSSAQHSLNLEAYHYFDALRLESTAGAEHFQSDYLRNSAYYGEAKFRPFAALLIKAQARQEHLSTPQAKAFTATSYGGDVSIQARDIGCAPSRANLRLISSRLHMESNTAWLNSLTLEVPFYRQKIKAQISYNRYSGAEDIDLGWIHWQQLGQQKSIGAYLQFSGSSRIIYGEGNVRYWASYSYNQTQFNPYSVPLQGRQASLGGAGLAFQMPQMLPTSILAAGQEMSWQDWRFHFNLWAWLQNQDSQIGNGLALQEIQLSWGHQFKRKSKLDQCRLYLHGQNLLQFSERANFAQLPYQAHSPAFAQNPSLLLGMEISLF